LFGHYAPGPRGTNGIKWYEWVPYGATNDYKKTNFYIIVFYLPLYLVDRHFCHTDDGAWDDDSLYPKEKQKLLKTVELDDMGVQAKHYADSKGNLGIYLTQKENEEFLCYYENDANALMSPNKKYLLVNGSNGSDSSSVEIYKNDYGLKYTPTYTYLKEKALKFYKEIKKKEKDKPYDQLFISGEKWINNECLEINLTGYDTKTKSKFSFKCFYKIPSYKFSIKP
jgi:hypothetical protein